MMDDDNELEKLRSEVRDLRAALGQGNQNLAVTFKLPPVLTNLMGLLLALPNVTAEMIQQRLGIATDAKVAMHRLRAHMKPYDIKIYSRRQLGYWLEVVDKDRINQMIEDNLPGNSTARDSAQFAEEQARNAA